MKHLEEVELMLYYYRDGDRVAEAEQHIAACSECHTRLKELSRDLESITISDLPERPPDYGIEVWNRIRAHLPEPQPRHPWWRTIPAWAVAGALATLVIAAFILGRYSRPPQNPPIVAHATNPQQVRERVLQLAVLDHLDRSQMLLIELSHASSDTDLDISQEQQHALELVAANRLYRTTAQQVGDNSMAGVLDELERVLLQIGHQPDKVSAKQLKQIQDQIQAQGILFKVRVIRTKMRDETTPRKRSEAIQKGPTV
ncbi:MAG TPA: hypothetical protein VGF08_01390 [Terriglobales bacterium]|jgi:hypothetical protein